MTENELFYLLQLQKTPNLGDISAKKLIQKLGSAEAVFKEKKSALLKIDGIGPFRIDQLQNQSYAALAEDELHFIQKQGITVWTYQDAKYPEHLKQCVDGPLILFSKGNIRMQNKPIISIVGTRKITTYGATICQQLIEELAKWDVVVVSGYAFGVDITAHRAALKNNLQTVACLAHGFDQIYPKEHKKYQEDVEANGGFITEFWSSDVFDRNNFLKRNRIIAGISEATIVIESASRGGSLVTAELANSYHREVFAVPGRIGDKQSAGCNHLIKTHQAQLLTSVSDLVYLLNWNTAETPKKPIQKQLFVELNAEEKKIITYLEQKQKQHIDQIALQCNLSLQQAVSLLFTLEMKGLIVAFPGKIYGISN